MAGYTPKGITYNNPLNIKAVGDLLPNPEGRMGPTSNWNGTTQVIQFDSGSYPIFDTMLNGARAAVLNMWTKMHTPQTWNGLGGRKANTPYLLARSWCAGDEGKWRSYGGNVAKAIGIGEDEQIDFNNVNHIVRAFRAMEIEEVGKYVTSDEDLARAVKDAYAVRGYTVTDAQIGEAIKAIGSPVAPNVRAVQGTAASADKLLASIYRLPDIARALTPASNVVANPANQEVDNVLYEPIGVAANGKQYFRGVGFIDASKANGRSDPKGQIFERTDDGFKQVLADVPGGAQLYAQATQIRDAVKGVKFEGDGAADYSKYALAITAAELQDTGSSAAGALARKPDEAAAVFAKTAQAVKEVEAGIGRRLSAEEFYLAHHLSRRNIEAGAITQAIKEIKDHPDALLSVALSKETIKALGSDVYVTDQADKTTKIATDGTFSITDLARWSKAKADLAQSEDAALERRRADIPTIKQNPLAETLANIQSVIKSNSTVFGSRAQIDAAILAELRRVPDPAAPAKGVNAYLTQQVMRYMQLQLKTPELASKGIDAAKYDVERGVLAQADIDALVAEAQKKDPKADIASIVASGAIKKETAPDGKETYIDPNRAEFGEQSQKVHQLVADTLPEKVNDPTVVEGTPVSEVAKDYRKGRDTAETEAEAKRQADRVRDQSVAGGMGMDAGDAFFLCLLMGAMTGRWDLAHQLFMKLTGSSGGPTSSPGDRADYRKGDGPTHRYEKRKDVDEKPAREKPPFGSGYPTGATDIIPEVTHKLPILPIDKGGPLYQQFWIPTRNAASTGTVPDKDKESDKGIVVIVNRDTGKVLYAAEHPAEIQGDLEKGGKILRWGTTSGADRDIKAYWDAYAYILGSQTAGLTPDTPIADIVKAGQAKLDQIAALTPPTDQRDPQYKAQLDDYKAKLKAITGDKILPEFMTTLSRDPARWKSLIVKESQPINGKVDTNFNPLKSLPNSHYSVGGFDNGNDDISKNPWFIWKTFIKTREGAVPVHLFPVEAEQMRITSLRGPRPHIHGQHDGVDIGDGKGTLYRMVAPADSIVLAYQNNGNDNQSYLALGHSDGSVTVYRHVKIADGVKVGNYLKQGQWAATMGTPSEIHVHYERWDRFGAYAPMTFAGIDGDISKFPKVESDSKTPRFGIAQSRAALEKINAEIAAKNKAEAEAKEAARIKAEELAKAEGTLKALEADLVAKRAKAEAAAKDVTAKEQVPATAADEAKAAELLATAKIVAARAQEEARAAEALLAKATTELDAVRTAATTPVVKGEPVVTAGPETGVASTIPNGAGSFVEELRRWNAEYQMYMMEQAKNSPPAADGRIAVPHPYPTKSIVNGYSLPPAAREAAKARGSDWVFYAVGHDSQMGEVGFYNIKTNEHVWFPAGFLGHGPEDITNGSTPGIHKVLDPKHPEGINMQWDVSFEAGHRFDPVNGVIRLKDKAETGRDGILIHTDFGSFRPSNGCPHIPAEMIPALMAMFKRTGVSELEMLNMPFVKQLLAEAEKVKYQRPPQPIAARSNGVTPETTLAKLNDGWVPYFYAIQHEANGITPDLKDIKALTVVIDPDNAMYGGVRLRDMSPNDRVDAIRKLREGGRTVIAYRSVGEAQDYSWYWKPEWNDRAQRPSFIKEENPQWPGNFRVNFTDPQWLAIVKEDMKRAADLGFDSVYLDVVDVYKHVNRTEKDMVTFLDEATKSIRDRGMDVISQNALELVINNPEIHKIISGVGVEQAFANAKGDMPLIEKILSRKGAGNRDMYVLGIEYTQDQAAREAYSKAAMAAGMIPFNGDTDQNLQGKTWNENRMAWAKAWAALSPVEKQALATKITNIAPPAKVSMIDGVAGVTAVQGRIENDPRRASFAKVGPDEKGTGLRLVSGNNPDNTDIHPASTMKWVTLWNVCRIFGNDVAARNKFLDEHKDQIEVMLHGPNPAKPDIVYDSVAAEVARDAAIAAGLKDAHKGGAVALQAFMDSANAGVAELGIPEGGFKMTGPGGSGKSSPHAIAAVGYVLQRDFKDVLDRFAKADGQRYGDGYAPPIYDHDPKLTQWSKPGVWNGNYAWAGAAPGIGYAVFSKDQGQIKAGIKAAESKVDIVAKPVTAKPQPTLKKIKMIDAGHGPIPDVKREANKSFINYGGGGIDGLSEFQANMLQAYAIGIELRKQGGQPAYTHLTNEQNLALIKSGTALPPGITEDDVRQAQDNPAIMAKIEQSHRWWTARDNPSRIATRFDWRIQAALDLKAAGYEVNYFSIHHNSNKSEALRGAEVFAHVDAGEASFLLANIIGDRLKLAGEVMSSQKQLQGYIDELIQAKRITLEKANAWLLGNVAVHNTSDIQPIKYIAPDKPEWDVKEGLGSIPATLIEMRYATNPEDAKSMKSAFARFTSAATVAQGMLDADSLRDRNITTIDAYKTVTGRQVTGTAGGPIRKASIDTTPPAVERYHKLTGAELSKWRGYFTSRIFNSESSDDRFHYDELKIPTSGAGLTPASLIQSMAQFPSLFTDSKWQPLKDALAGKNGQPPYQFGTELQGGQLAATIEALKVSNRDDATQILFNKYLLAPGVVGLPAVIQENVLDMAFNAGIDQAIICLRHTLNAKGFKVPDLSREAQQRPLTDQERATYGKVDKVMQDAIEQWMKSYGTHPELANNDYSLARIRAYENIVRIDNAKFDAGDMAGYAGHVKNLDGWRNRVSQYIFDSDGQRLSSGGFGSDKKRLIGWTPPSDLVGVDHGSRRGNAPPKRHLEIKKPLEVFWPIEEKFGKRASLELDGLSGGAILHSVKLAALPADMIPAGVVLSDAGLKPLSFDSASVSLAALGVKLDVPNVEPAAGTLDLLNGLQALALNPVKKRLAQLQEEERAALERIAKLKIEEVATAQRLAALTAETDLAAAIIAGRSPLAAALQIQGASIVATANIANDKVASEEQARLQVVAMLEEQKRAAAAEARRAAEAEARKVAAKGDDKKDQGTNTVVADAKDLPKVSGGAKGIA